MESLDQTLNEVSQLYQRLTGNPPPEPSRDVAIPPIPADADPLEFVLKEVQYLKDHLTSRTGHPSMVQGTFVPPVDAFLGGDTLSISVDLPGIKKEDISLSVTGSTLVLRGLRPDQNPKRDGQVLAIERAHGTFERYIPLPGRVKVEALKAELNSGVLEIEIPLVQEKAQHETRVKIA